MWRFGEFGEAKLICDGILRGYKRRYVHERLPKRSWPPGGQDIIHPTFVPNLPFFLQPWQTPWHRIFQRLRSSRTNLQNKRREWWLKFKPRFYPQSFAHICFDAFLRKFNYRVGLKRHLAFFYRPPVLPHFVQRFVDQLSKWGGYEIRDFVWGGGSRVWKW
jgi:hypothetical protein